ncbi:MAG: IclR family transcriptional regulator [Hyphomicrobiaceae bacterium]|nr:MAG: IclR family transcriptional regulator [Hyphomicrobiaceae bacterium]
MRLLIMRAPKPMTLRRTSTARVLRGGENSKRSAIKPLAARPDPVQRNGQGDLAQLGAMGKAFLILELIASGRRPMPMSDIVAAAGLTKPTAHRITSALAELGFIERDALKRGYVEGPRLVSLALNALLTAAQRTLRHAILKSVSEKVGETCNFGVLTGSEVIYLDRVEAKWPLGLRFEAGSRVPAHCTAIGKLLLALTPEPARRQIMNALPLARYTSRSLTNEGDFAAAIEKIARSEVGIDDQEFIDGVVCVSVPVRTSSGSLIGGIAVSAPEARVSLEQLMKFVPTMRQAAGQLAATYDIYPEQPPKPAASD